MKALDILKPFLLMTAQTIVKILETHIPPAAVEYCLQLWKESPFELKITKSRNTKVGDFTSKGSKAHPRITLNQDLNAYLFLQTYVHEIAHLRVYLKYGNRVDPHGDEWKGTFTDLMIPILWDNIFPEDVLHELRRHMINPKASSYADSKLIEVFRRYDRNAASIIILAQLPEGSIFQFHGRYFRKGKLRRTRVLCMEMKSKRNYLVPSDAMVTNVQLSLL
jgi:SprT protein